MQQEHQRRTNTVYYQKWIQYDGDVSGLNHIAKFLISFRLAKQIMAGKPIRKPDS